MSTQQRHIKFVVHGFVRQYSTDNMPCSLIKLILLFYDLWFYCILSKQNVIELQQQKSENRIKYSKILSLCNLITIRLEFVVDNKTYYFWDENNQMYELQNSQKNLIRSRSYITSVPSYVSSLVVFMQVRNQTLNLNYKGSYKMDFRREMLIPYLRRERNLGSIFDFHVNNNDNPQNFHFDFLFYIKDIKYTDDTYSNIVKDIINLKAALTYKWTIQGNLFTYLSKARFRQSSSSPAFNNASFYLTFFPAGNIIRSASTLYIECIDLPQDITSIDVRINCICNYGIEHVTIWSDATRNGSEKCIFKTGATDDMWLTGKLMFSIDMKITNIYSNNKKIETTEWKKYGIFE